MSVEAIEPREAQSRAVFEAIKQLIASPPPPAKELGFHTIPSATSTQKPTRRPIA